MTTTQTRRPKDVLKACFPNPVILNEFVQKREKFFRNTGIIVTMDGNSIVHFSTEEYKKVPFINFEVLNSDLKKIIGYDNVYWTTIQ